MDVCIKWLGKGRLFLEPLYLGIIMKSWGFTVFSLSLIFCESQMVFTKSPLIKNCFKWLIFNDISKKKVCSIFMLDKDNYL